MYSTDDPAVGRGHVIAVIGGGASGTLTTIHLLREAAGRRVPLRVALIDRHGRHGLGQAYSTTHPAHLLNSPTDTMSALAGDPGHLARWAEAAGLPHDGFLPRSAYGRYLTELLTAEERSAQPAARVSHITSEVVAIRRGSRGRALRLHLAADGRIDADAVVLATGNLPSSPSARHCADAGTRRQPSRRSATRPPHSPATCSAGRRTRVPAAPRSQSIAQPTLGTDHRQCSAF